MREVTKRLLVAIALLGLPVGLGAQQTVTIPQDPAIDSLRADMAAMLDLLAGLEGRLDSVISALAPDTVPAYQLSVGAVTADSVELLFRFQEGTWDGFIGFRDDQGSVRCPPARPPVTSPARTWCPREAASYRVWADDPFPHRTGPVTIPPRSDPGPPAPWSLLATAVIDGRWHRCRPTDQLVEVPPRAHAPSVAIIAFVCICVPVAAPRG